MVGFTLNGVDVEVPDDGCSLLEALRDRLGVRSPKDGCSPQGQCGCCTVWVDGSARVACVTPVRRVQGREVTTVEGLDDAGAWGAAFCAAGASQCGFCTPGIVMRLAALPPPAREDADAVDRALLAHLCRCTGWQTIREAAARRDELSTVGGGRDLAAAAERARLEGGVPQAVGADVALGMGGFADDTAPADALVAVLGAGGEWVVGETLTAAREQAGKVQGRRSTAPLTWPVEIPPGKWSRTLQTTWTEPGYVEPDAAWCVPGGEPASPLGNGGAFGGKTRSAVAATARRLADEHGRAVRVLLSREDTVRRGAKRPPVALGMHADGSGRMRIARPSDRADEQRLVDAVGAHAPSIEVEFAEVVGPPTSADLRAAGWAEVAVGLASLRDDDRIVAPGGAVASAAITAPDGRERIDVRVRCGRPLDAVVLRSYCIGATHMALSWVRSEALAVAADGTPLDLTIRSFGILRAVDMPPVDVTIEDDDGPPVNGSDAVFAAVAAAAWRAAGHPPRWPTGA